MKRKIQLGTKNFNTKLKKNNKQTMSMLIAMLPIGRIV